MVLRNPTKAGTTTSCFCGDVIITVEELERRKDRFRRATKEYYEQSERNFRSVHGFYSASAPKNNNNIDKENLYTIGSKRKRSLSEGGLPRLKRCRRSRSATIGSRPKDELEVELARCLLVSSFEIVQVAIDEYLASICGLIRIVPQWWNYLDPPLQLQVRRRQHATNDDEAYHQLLLAAGGASTPEGESFLLSLPLPLPLLFETNRTDESLAKRLGRHLSEVIEEQHTAMAAAMIAVRETKITGEFAKKIHNGIESLQVALRRVSCQVAAHGNSTLYCIHYDGNGSVETAGDAAARLSPTRPASCTTKPPPQRHWVDSWKQSVVDARKLDGYFRWFRANNGVLLVNNKKHHHASTNDNAALKAADMEPEEALAVAMNNHHQATAMAIDGPSRNLRETS